MRSFIRHIFALFTISLASAFPTHAFTLDTYAESSVLSSGRWIKVSVTESGLHLIPTSTLRAWGFSDPSAVRIFGYGGARISDQLSRANYIDDLPAVKSELTANGIVFYAQGPGVWKQGLDNTFTHSLNPYSTKGYYFLTDSRPDTDNSIPTEGGEPTNDAATTFTERIYHELDLVTPAESGHQLVGEDFRYTSNRTFNFQLPGNAADSVWMQCDFFARSISSPVQLSFTANGQKLASASGDNVPKTAEWGRTASIRKRFPFSGNSLALGIGININTPVSLANLDRILLTYTREIAMPSSGPLVFTTTKRSVKLKGFRADTRVWDVTNPNSPIAMPVTSAADGTGGWTNDYNGMRTYAAWSTAAGLPNPRFAGNVANQNLHAVQTPDMI
ncbi:MAG: hypothetical protein K2G17_05670, partial [Duncaniella sp.]|nr:hypothetical protein [Duncaniella sp.]